MTTTTFHSPLFRWGTILADDDYRVILFERFRLKYEEEGLSLIFAYESVPGTMQIFHESVCASSSGKSVLLDAETDKRVCARLLGALTWRGFDVTFVS